MKGSRHSGGGRRREGPRPHKHSAPGTPGGRAGGRGSGGFFHGSPKTGKRLPLPKKTGGPMDTKRGSKGYTRPTGRTILPVEDLDSVEESLRVQSSGSCTPTAPRYELLDHTADLGIRVKAGSIEKLFENAGLALLDLLTDVGSVRPTESYELSLAAEDLESLLVEWLRELLYFFFAKKTAFCGLEIVDLSENSLRAVCRGERFLPERHTYRTEIKAVTYHGLSVARSDEGWTADVIFDI